MQTVQQPYHYIKSIEELRSYIELKKYIQEAYKKHAKKIAVIVSSINENVNIPIHSFRRLFDSRWLPDGSFKKKEENKELVILTQDLAEKLKLEQQTPKTFEDISQLETYINEH